MNDDTDLFPPIVGTLPLPTANPHTNTHFDDLTLEHFAHTTFVALRHVDLERRGNLGAQQTPQTQHTHCEQQIPQTRYTQRPHVSLYRQSGVATHAQRHGKCHEKGGREIARGQLHQLDVHADTTPATIASSSEDVCDRQTYSTGQDLIGLYVRGMNSEPAHRGARQHVALMCSGLAAHGVGRHDLHSCVAKRVKVRWFGV